MTPKRAFKGVWVPAFIWNSSTLNWFEKCLLAEIDSLDDDTGCYAKNSYIAEKLNCHPDHIKRSITSLRASGWIKDRSDPMVNRRISIVKSEEERIRGGGHRTPGGVDIAQPPPPSDHIKDLDTIQGTSLCETEDVQTENQKELIYQEYPKKVGKPDALKAIKKALRSIPFSELLAKTKAFAALWAETNDFQFCPNPSTWFNQNRFEDHPSTWNRPPESFENPQFTLKKLEAQKATHPCNPEYVKHNPNASPEQKQAYRDLKARITELKRSMGE